MASKGEVYKRHDGKWACRFFYQGRQRRDRGHRRRAGLRDASRGEGHPREGHERASTPGPSTTWTERAGAHYSPSASEDVGWVIYALGGVVDRLTSRSDGCTPVPNRWRGLRSWGDPDRHGLPGGRGGGGWAGVRRRAGLRVRRRRGRAGPSRPPGRALERRLSIRAPAPALRLLRGGSVPGVRFHRRVRAQRRLLRTGHRSRDLRLLRPGARCAWWPRVG